MKNRVMLGITRRYRVIVTMSVVTKDGDTNKSIAADITSNLIAANFDHKSPGGSMVLEHVEDVEYIPDTERAAR